MSPDEATMASSHESAIAENIVCLTCGSKGDSKCLICCVECEDSYAHKYCLDELPSDVEYINWTCWDCEHKTSQVIPSRKSERISSKQDQAVEARSCLKQRLRFNCSKTQKIFTESEHVICPARAKTEVDLQKVEVPGTAPLVDGPLPDLVKETLYVLSNTPSDVTNEKRRRKLLFYDESDSEEHCQPIFSREDLGRLVSKHEDEQFSKPCTEPIWRGYFSFPGTGLAILAHLASTASQKVIDAAIRLPKVLETALLPKSKVWPMNFSSSPPTESTIGLYFFPENERAEKLYDALVDQIIDDDLALKNVADNLELLIFSSLELPQQNWRYQRKYYLWGVFKRVHRSPPPMLYPNQVLKDSNCNQTMTPTSQRAKGDFCSPSKENDHLSDSRFCRADLLQLNEAMQEDSGDGSMKELHNESSSVGSGCAKSR